MNIDELLDREIPPESLRESVGTFENLLAGIDREMDDVLTVPFSFVEGFRSDLEEFCIYIATSDGEQLSDHELSRINWLLSDDISQEEARRVFAVVHNPAFSAYYPQSFQALVHIMGTVHDDEESFDRAITIPHYFLQLTRYLWSIGHDTPYDSDNPSWDYVTAFPVYVSRVSKTGYIPPRDEPTIEDTIEAYRPIAEAEFRQAKEEIAEQRAQVCGLWRAMQGEVTASKLMLDYLYVAADGTGYMASRPSRLGKRNFTWQMNAQFGQPIYRLVFSTGMTCLFVVSEDKKALLGQVQGIGASEEDAHFVYLLVSREG